MSNIMYTPQATGNRARKTVGVLLSYSANFEEVQLLEGVMSVAETQNYNVVSIFGGQVFQDSPRNTGFDLVSPERFDGVLISAPVATSASTAQMATLRNKVAGIPVVTGAMDFESVPQVYADSYGGMQALVRHLVEEHDYRRIAFLGGEQGHPEADARYKAYCDVLQEAGIEHDERLVVHGQFLIDFGRVGMSALLERDIDIDVVVCASDDMAYGAYEVLHAHGIQVPDGMALTGFDDAPIAQELPVPLTTVNQSFYQMGQQMMVILTGLMAGQPVPERLLSQAQAVIRRSCGCQPGIEDVVQKYDGAVVDLAAMPVPNDVPDLIWETFLQDTVKPSAGSGRFITTLERFLADAFSPDADYQIWHDVVHTLRGTVIQSQVSDESLHMALNLLDRARVLIIETEQRRIELTRAAQRDRTELLRLFDELLMGAADYMTFAHAVQQYLGRLGFAQCYIVQGNPDDVSRLVLSYDNGTASVQDIPVAPQSIIPESEWFTSERHSWIIMPLVAQNRAIGYTVISYVPNEGESYEHFSTQFSGAVFRIQLLGDVASAQQETEQSLTQVLHVREVMDKISAGNTIKDVWQAAVQGMCEFAHAHSVISVMGSQDELTAFSEDVDFNLPTYSAGEVAVPRWLPLMTDVVERSRVIHERSADGIAQLVIPLIWSGNMVGVVAFQRAGKLWESELLDSLGDIFDHALVTYENRRLLGDLQQRAARLEVSAELSTALATITDVRVLLDSAITLVQDRFAFAFVSVFLADESRRYAVISAGRGGNAHELLAQDFRVDVGGTSTVGQCLNSSEVVHLPSVRPEGFVSQRVLSPGSKSALAVPVLSRGQALGVLLIEDTHAEIFEPQDITILQTMANQMGNAIENARSLEQMEQNLRALETVTGEYTRTGWENYFGQQQEDAVAYRFSGVEVEPVDTPNPEVVQAIKANESVVHLLMGDAAETGTAVGVPVRLRNQVLGALNVRFNQQDVPEETIGLINQIADRLAVSLESARLLSETRRTAERDRLVAEVTDRIRQPFAIEDVLEAAATEIRRLMNAEQVNARLFPEGILESEDMLRGLVAGLAVTSTPEGISETDHAPLANTITAMQESREIQTEQTNWLSVPVRGGDRTLGAIEVRKRMDAGAWTNEEITLLNTLSTQLSAVVERARLYNETQRIAARQRTIAEVGAQMRSSLNLSDVLRTAADAIRKSLDLGEVVVQLGTVDEQDVVEAA